MMNYVLKMMNFALKMSNFAPKGEPMEYVYVASVDSHDPEVAPGIGALTRYKAMHTQKTNVSLRRSDAHTLRRSDAHSQKRGRSGRALGHPLI